MENLKKYTKLKSELLDRKEQALLKQATGLQSALLERIVDDFISKLDVENGYIKNTRANKNRIAALNRIFEKFNNGDFVKVVQSMVEGFKEIHGLNIRYFSQINAKKVTDIQALVFDRMKSNFGIEGRKLTPGGFLDSFIKDPKLLEQVKQTTFRAITSDNITMKDYRESIKRIIVGNDKIEGGFERHFKTFATDAYSLFDRSSNYEFATTLGMGFAIYAGGLIETSRPFCIVRNNKVFTIKEIKKFGTSKDTYGGYSDKETGEFAGKWKNRVYDPVTDCGCHNCKHTWNWISEALAKRMRPDLK